jgi:hypothetical protein
MGIAAIPLTFILSPAAGGEGRGRGLEGREWKQI